MGCCQSSTSKQFKGLRDLYRAEAQGNQEAERKIYLFHAIFDGDRRFPYPDQEHIKKLLSKDGLTKGRVKEAKAIANEKSLNLGVLLPSLKDRS